MQFATIYKTSPTLSIVCYLTTLLFYLDVIPSLALLELIAKNGFIPRQEGPSDFSGAQGPRQRKSNNDGTGPEEKPSDNSKPYTADQLEAVRR